MDRSVENIHLIMTKENLDFNEKQLPEGYEFVMYESGMMNKWIEIQLSSKHILERLEGENYFKDVFLKNENFLKESMIFIKDSKGDLVGTGAIWEGKYFPQDKNKSYRLHWIAVDPKHGGKGLAKAIVSKLLSIFKDKKMGEGLYLSTQTCSYVAIKIYLDFGFKPYDLEKNQKGWDIVFNKINVQ
ncbi:GNAT family N-acetyltransferase [Cetobacterium somerae]|uniref:GNAT family N-acetyltransferase n=1 Tax=Cetobacterium somerae TaxID=188913 RepID=UPI001F07108A|nr:GNAT family N-acetyltransferase [Cetobacterium somerae]UPO97545.1 GNAT family N-acetyltransferase [Cetobacterium somerae]